MQQTALSAGASGASHLSMWAFKFEGHDLRIVDRDGNPWFVGKDVAAAIGYRDTDAAVRRHCKSLQFLKPDEASGLDVPSRGFTIIPEADVYRLIMRSGLPSAERFEEWVVGEVLPQVRRTGSYNAPVDPMVLLNDAASMRVLLLSYTEKVIALEADKASMAPKVEALARIAESEGSFCITDAAKTLQVGPKALFKFLRAHGWIYARTGSAQDVAYQSKLASGLLEHKTTTVSRSDGSEKTVTQVRVTPKGLTRLAQEFPPAARMA